MQNQLTGTKLAKAAALVTSNLEQPAIFTDNGAPLLLKLVSETPSSWSSGWQLGKAELADAMVEVEVVFIYAAVEVLL